MDTQQLAEVREILTGKQVAEEYGINEGTLRVRHRELLSLPRSSCCSPRWCTRHTPPIR